MPDLVTAAAAIIGAFIGGTAAAVTSYLADRRRFKREDAYRDYAERREAYTDFISSWFAYEDVLHRPPPLGPASPAERNEAQLRLLHSFNTLSLIAPDEVRAAAADVQNGVSDAPGRFWKAARKDLGKGA